MIYSGSTKGVFRKVIRQIFRSALSKKMFCRVDFSLAVAVDYIILDGRGGGKGSAPKILRNYINVPTIPALARGRKYLDKIGTKDVTLVITGRLRVAEDFAKAMELAADAIAVYNSALRAIGSLGMRACDSNK